MLVSNIRFLKLSTNYFSLFVVVCIAVTLRLRRHSVTSWIEHASLPEKVPSVAAYPHPFESAAIPITKVAHLKCCITPANWPLRTTFLSFPPRSYESEDHTGQQFLPHSTGYQPYAYSRTTCSSYRATGISRTHSCTYCQER